MWIESTLPHPQHNFAFFSLTRQRGMRGTRANFLTLINRASASGEIPIHPPSCTTRRDPHSLCMHPSITSDMVMQPLRFTFLNSRHPSHRFAKPWGLHQVNIASGHTIHRSCNTALFAHVCGPLSLCALSCTLCHCGMHRDCEILGHTNLFTADSIRTYS